MTSSTAAAINSVPTMDVSAATILASLGKHRPISTVKVSSSPAEYVYRKIINNYYSVGKKTLMGPDAKKVIDGIKQKKIIPDLKRSKPSPSSKKRSSSWLYFSEQTIMDFLHKKQEEETRPSIATTSTTASSLATLPLIPVEQGYISLEEPPFKKRRTDLTY